jgi:membrane protein implicated in regulation of membrane protease activity
LSVGVCCRLLLLQLFLVVAHLADAVLAVVMVVAIALLRCPSLQLSLLPLLLSLLLMPVISSAAVAVATSKANAKQHQTTPTTNRKVRQAARTEVTVTNSVASPPGGKAMALKMRLVCRTARLPHSLVNPRQVRCTAGLPTQLSIDNTIAP